MAENCDELDGDVAVVGRLGVNSRCASFTPDSPSLYVNGEVQADGVVTADALRFNVQGKPVGFGFSASGEAGQQVGVNASLRIASSLGLGTDQREDVSSVARLIVTADRVGNPTQVWRAGARQLAIVDADGRFGVGTSGPAANLAVQSGLIHKLDGNLSGSINRPEVHGDASTHFDTQLHDGDYIRLDAAGPQPFKVTVKGPHELLIDPFASNTFQGANAFAAESPLDIRAASGDELLSMDRWGNATLSASLTVRGDSQLNTLTTTSLATVDSLTVKHAAIMEGSLTVTSPAHFLSSVNVEGGGVIRSNATGANLQIGGGSFYFGWLPNIPNGTHLVFNLADDSGRVGYVGSSRTIKENIEPLQDDFERILDLQVQAFNYTDAPGTTSIGYIAEDVAALGLHHLVVCDPRGKPVAIHYDRIPLYHQELIKDLRSRVDALDEKLSRLQD